MVSLDYLNQTLIITFQVTAVAIRIVYHRVSSFLIVRYLYINRSKGLFFSPENKNYLEKFLPMLFHDSRK
jgi:hypothetical protein